MFKIAQRNQIKILYTSVKEIEEANKYNF